MRELSLSDVIKNFGISVFSFTAGLSFGVFFGFFLSIADKSLLQSMINFFVERTTFGEQYFGSYKIWFIVNNLFALLLIVGSAVLMMSVFLRKKRPTYFKKFRRFEETRPKVTLYSLYVIPIGALFINGAIVSLLLVYTLVNFGYKQFETVFILLTPHGATELLGLIFASSIVLAYLEVLKPYILNGRWDDAKKIGKRLLFSNVTLIVVFFIVLLIIFSGYIEGSFATMLSG